MKLLKNRRKLNNKGFTLIELLAVVVILAIVMGISATSVLNSINNSRSSSLYSAAQNAANTLNTWVTEDAVVSTEKNKMLGDAFIKATQGTNVNKWVCLKTGDIVNIRNRDGKDTDPSVSLLTALGINEKDIVLSDKPLPTQDGKVTNYVPTEGDDPTCSALRYNGNSGGYEVLLIAADGGKYYVTTDSTHYAYSRATAVNTPITD